MASIYTITSQILNLIKILNNNNINFVIAAINQLASIYGDNVWAITLHFLFTNIMALSEADNQKFQESLARLSLSHIYTSEFYSVPNIITLAFHGLHLYPDFLTTLFAKLELPFDLQVSICLNLSKTTDSQIISESFNILNSDTLVANVANGLSSRSFSLRILHDLLFKVQKSPRILVSIKKKLLSQVGEEYKKHPLHKSMRLLIFEQNIFNYKSNHGGMARLRSQLDCQHSKPDSIAFTAAIDIMRSNTLTPKIFANFIISHKFSTEAEIAQILCALMQKSQTVPRLAEDSRKHLSNPLGGKLKENSGVTRTLNTLGLKANSREEIVVKTLKAIHPRLKWDLVLEGLDCRHLKSGGNLLYDSFTKIISLIGSNAIPKLKQMLYEKKWNFPKAHFVLLNLSMRMPKEFAVKSHLKSSELLTNHPHDGALESFTNLDFIETLLTFTEPPESEYIGAILDRFLPTRSAMLYQVINKSNCKNDRSSKFKLSLQKKIVISLLRGECEEKKNPNSLNELFAINCALTTSILDEELTRNPRIFERVFEALNVFAKDKHNKITSPKAEAILKKMGCLHLTLSVALEFAERKILKNFPGWLSKTAKTYKVGWMSEGFRTVLLRNLEGLVPRYKIGTKSSSFYAVETVGNLARVLGDKGLHMLYELYKRIHAEEHLKKIAMENYERCKAGEKETGRVLDELCKPSRKNDLSYFALHFLKMVTDGTESSWAIAIFEELSQRKPATLSINAKNAVETTISALLKEEEESINHIVGSKLLKSSMKMLEELPGLCKIIMKETNSQKKFPRPMEKKEKSLNDSLKSQKLANLTTESQKPVRKPQTVLEEGPNEAEGESVREKMIFILNNLSPKNCIESAVLVDEKLSPLMFPFFAHRFIKFKVSQEANHRDTFLSFYRLIQQPNLKRMIRAEAYEITKGLISREAVEKAANNKNLSNMADWMGATLLRNDRPLLSCHLDLSELLTNAYFAEKNRDKWLLAVVVFTVTLLCHCANSNVFKLPCPWTNSILSLLKEMYTKEVELNVRFEIERLAKALKIDLSKVQHSYVLTMRDFGKKATQVAVTMREKRHEQTAENPSLKDTPEKVHSELLMKLNFEMRNFIGFEMIRDPMTSFNEVVAGKSKNIPNTMIGLSEESRYINTYLQRHTAFNQKCFPVGAIEAEKTALREGLSVALSTVFVPLVIRSVGIATQTTVELLHKDFGFEPDMKVYVTGAIYTARSLAGNLLLATVREPLRMEVYSVVLSVLRRFHNDVQLIESASKLLCKENFLVCMQLLNNLTDDKIRHEIFCSVRKAVEVRQKYKQEGLHFPGECVAMPSDKKDVLNAQKPLFPNCLPFKLQPKRNGLTQKQLTLYKNFQALLDQQQRSLRDWTLRSEFPEPWETEVPLDSNDIEPSGAGLEHFDVRRAHEFPNMEFLAQMISEDKVSEQIKGLQSHIDKEEISNFDTVKIFHGSEILMRFEQTATLLKTYPNFTCRLQSLPPEVPAMKYAKAFLKLLDNECTSATNDNRRKVILLLLGDHIYSEMFQMSFNLLFLDFSAEALHIIKNDSKFSELLTKRLTRFYVGEPDNKKYCMEVFLRLMLKKLLTTRIIDYYFATVMTGHKPYLDARSVYFIATFFEEMMLAKGEFQWKDFPRISRVYKGIREGIYNTDRLEKSAVRYLCSRKTSDLNDNVRSKTNETTAKPTWANSVATNSLRKHAAKTTPPEGNKPLPSVNTQKTNDRKPQTDKTADPFEFKVDMDNEQRAAAKLLLIEWNKACSSSTSRLNFFRSKGFTSKLREESFFRAVAEEVFSRAARTEDYDELVQEMDALALLIYSFAESIVLTDPTQIGGLLTQFRVLIDLVQHQQTLEEFDPRPAQSLFQKILRLFRFMDFLVDKVRTQILVLFIECFTHLQPSKAPGFVFSWLELVTERSFIYPILSLNNEYAGKCRYHTMRLICSLLKFVEPLLCGESFDEALSHVYFSLLRTFVLLRREFGFFVSDFYFDFAMAIPQNCVQLRNIVLDSASNEERRREYFYGSATSMLDSIPPIKERWTTLLKACDAGEFGSRCAGVKADLDTFLSRLNDSKNDHSLNLPADYFSRLEKKLRNPPTVSKKKTVRFLPPFRYNRRVMGAITAYMGASLLNNLTIFKNTTSSERITAFLDRAFVFFRRLLVLLQPEGRYHMVSVLADQLRQHNPHTHLFSLAVLAIFGKSQDKDVREVIFRVLMERLCAKGPHPPGLIAIFKEFTDNPFYGLSVYSFSQCGPRIEKLFEDLCRRYSNKAK